jgi:hypothetical protein
VAAHDGFDGLIGVRLGVDQSPVEIKEHGTHASAISHLSYFTRRDRARVGVARSHSTVPAAMCAKRDLIYQASE